MAVFDFLDFFDLDFLADLLRLLPPPIVVGVTGLGFPPNQDGHDHDHDFGGTVAVAATAGDLDAVDDAVGATDAGCCCCCCAGNIYLKIPCYKIGP